MYVKVKYVSITGTCLLQFPKQQGFFQAVAETFLTYETLHP